ncbi:putative membrane protein [Hydrogenispora ethanolica]|jgi:uncharacterized membrane protein|uniref:Putative membrane protein n=1 Tax=Hydrogenispora ethanolica TaxID=1082276 RepID=A0A4V2QF87_HYDET|nr:DUF4870 domain-containing protein [Hydrogenispora ethanolica]TCL70947.1 putative membrane protein [Hydrogenispora ethanolica]
MENLDPELRFLMAISYPVWPVSLLMVGTRLRKERFIRYHGYQALYLGICGTVIYLVAGPLLRLIPFIGPLLLRLGVMVWVVFELLLAIRCWQGDYFRVPLIYDLAQGLME